MSTTESVRSGVTVPTCPVCGEPLALGSRGDVDSWSCGRGHGLAMTLSEAHVALQDDEVALLWQLARSSREQGRPSPFAPHAPMVRITLPYDDDEAAEGEPGDTEDLGSVELDVDLAQQFIWYDAGELDQLPADLANVAPSPEELARLEQVRAQFSQDLGRALDARDDDELSERLYRHIAARPGLHRTLDKVGRTLTTY
jgi:Zn-finger nucleic acid-binding protein